jgi:hypothetical protein
LESWKVGKKMKKYKKKYKMKKYKKKIYTVHSALGVGKQ